MIHALVRITTPRAESRSKSLGDIVCVRLLSSPWGRLDRRMMQVIQLNDPELEARLEAMKKAGEKHPQITLPYAERDEEGTVTVFSARVLDVPNVPARHKTDWTRPEVAKGTITVNDAPIRIKTENEKRR